MGLMGLPEGFHAYWKHLAEIWQGTMLRSFYQPPSSAHIVAPLRPRETECISTRAPPVQPACSARGNEGLATVNMHPRRSTGINIGMISMYILPIEHRQHGQRRIANGPVITNQAWPTLGLQDGCVQQSAIWLPGCTRLCLAFRMDLYNAEVDVW